MMARKNSLAALSQMNTTPLPKWQHLVIGKLGAQAANMNAGGLHVCLVGDEGAGQEVKNASSGEASYRCFKF